jgi:hypothetical protein
MNITKSKHISRLIDARLDKWQKEQHSTLPNLKNWPTKAVWGIITYTQNVYSIIRLLVLLNVFFCLLFGVRIPICPVKKKNNPSYFVSARQPSQTLNETLGAKKVGNHWGTAYWPVNLKQRHLWPSTLPVASSNDSYRFSRLAGYRNAISDFKHRYSIMSNEKWRWI